MSISDNVRLAVRIDAYLEERAPVKLGVNKKNELIRLIYEMSRAQGLTPERVIAAAGLETAFDGGKDGFFRKFKGTLTGFRYPAMTRGMDPHIMPVKIGQGREECLVWEFDIAPRAIYIEKSVKDTDWVEGFTRYFPNAEKTVIENLKDGFSRISATDDIAMYNARRDNVFLVRNKNTFVKVCPCSEGCVRCGYWILNLGFGCPIDCSYCYLQMYSNAPGILIPANIEDYYEHILEFDRKAFRRTRIGTGEFADSLALDKYTGYSSALIPFFSKTRNLVLELKTKSADIDNVLREDPHENVVIAWSMNTREMAERYEKGGATVGDRIYAAKRAASRGYKVGFHFDPLIYHKGWEDAYRGVLEEIFSHEEIKRNTAWISLGTLRYTPGLKQTAEQRFSDTLMFYEGEFLSDVDGKLRYPRNLRADMYDKMTGWIREHNPSCWIYRCMEVLPASGVNGDVSLTHNAFQQKDL